MVNYYELLEVNEKASREIISKVFKVHIKKNHPDLFQGEEKTKAEEKIKLINEAYETLSDETKRKKYDEMLNAEKDKVIDDLKEEISMLRDELERSYEKINSMGAKNTDVSKQQPAEQVAKSDNIFSRIYNNRYDFEEPDLNYSDNEYNNEDNSYYEPQRPSVKDTYLKDIKRFFVKCAITVFLVIIFWIVVWKITGINIFEALFMGKGYM